MGDRLLTITLEVQIEGRKAYPNRIKAAYVEAAAAAESAVRAALLPGSVHAVHSSLNYATRYRHGVDGILVDDEADDLPDEH
jgi:hypothetical protein